MAEFSDSQAQTEASAGPGTMAATAVGLTKIYGEGSTLR